MFGSMAISYHVCFICYACVWQELTTLGNNYRFRELVLSECTSISDLGLQKFAQQCSNIERLDLSHCQVMAPKCTCTY